MAGDGAAEPMRAGWRWGATAGCLGDGRALRDSVSVSTRSVSTSVSDSKSDSDSVSTSVSGSKSDSRSSPPEAGRDRDRRDRDRARDRARDRDRAEFDRSSAHIGFSAASASRELPEGLRPTRRAHQQAYTLAADVRRRLGLPTPPLPSLFGLLGDRFGVHVEPAPLRTRRLEAVMVKDHAGTAVVLRRIRSTAQGRRRGA